MSETEQILAEIAEAAKRAKLAETTFCQRAVGNKRIPKTLRSGGSLTIKTLARLREYIAEHRDGAAA